jgi:hypothetical protein
MLPSKIVIIGAGSAIFGVNTIAALMRGDRLRGSHLVLWIGILRRWRWSSGWRRGLTGSGTPT